MKKAIFLVAMLMLAPQAIAQCWTKTVGIYVWSLKEILASEIGEDLKDAIKKETENPEPRNWSSFSIRQGYKLRNLNSLGKLHTSKTDFMVNLRGNGIPESYQTQKGINGFMKIEFKVDSPISIQEISFSFPNKKFRDSIVSPPIVPKEEERFLLGYTDVWRTNCIVYFHVVTE